jgi:hypothetical protein
VCSSDLLAEIVALAGKTPTKEELKTIVPEKVSDIRGLERVLDLFVDR